MRIVYRIELFAAVQRNQENLACFTSKFVEKYCGDLSNDLIVLMSCHSGQNEKLANSFIGKGATAVVGFTQTCIYGVLYKYWCVYTGVYDTNKC